MSNNIDANPNNADWTKKTWDLPKTIAELQTPFMTDTQFRVYMRGLMNSPIGKSMPESLIDELREKFGPNYVPRHLDKRQRLSMRPTQTAASSHEAKDAESSDLLPAGPEDFRSIEEFVDFLNAEDLSTTLFQRPLKDISIEIVNALNDADYSRYIFLHKKVHRTQAFKAISHELPDKAYWRLVSDLWLSTENIWQNLEDWKDLLTSLRSRREVMMNEVEQEYFANLKYTLTIYRGCTEGLNEGGLSWTLDRSVAETYASQLGEKGFVLERKINKPEIVAFLNRRGESEVIKRPFIKFGKSRK